MAEEKITAGEYVKFAQTDPSTFMGMRLAISDAAIHLKSKAIADGDYAQHTKTALDEAVDKNPYLKAAGTGELVKAYFHEVIDRQANPNAASKAFLNEVSIKASVIDNVRAGKQVSDDDLKSYGTKFLKSANKHLGIVTLTEDFRSETSNKQKLTDGIVIEPQPLSPEKADALASMESTFRRLDKIDAALFSVIGNKLGNAPAVNHLMAHTNKDIEVRLAPLIAASIRLRDGEPDDQMKKDIGSIKEILTGKNEPYTAEISAEEGKAIGQRLLNSVVRMRAGQPEATVGSMLEIISTKGKEPAKERPANEKNPFQAHKGSSASLLGQLIEQGKDVFSSAVENIEKLVGSGGLLAAVNSHKATQETGQSHSNQQLGDLPPQLLSADASRTQRNDGRTA